MRTLLVAGVWAALLAAGCQPARRDVLAQTASRLYPPPPQTPRVIALGNLRAGSPPSPGEVELAMFLFGTEPPTPLGVVNPAGLAVRGDSVLICDTALDAVLRWTAGSNRVNEEPFSPRLSRPFALSVTQADERLVCDAAGVRRTDAAGNLLCRYAMDGAELKPGGVLAVDDAVWVSNLAAHRVEVFDAASGRHLRSLGQPGRGRGQLALPRGLARTSDGGVCVVDTLNNCVRVLDRDGRWLRDIGQPGDSPGTFGRPKDVAVGPDGTVFVTDDFSQRVQVFSSDGQPLLAFGEPGSGAGQLTLPSGIAISTTAPAAEHVLPADAAPAYYVLVGERLARPGVRVYAWLGGQGSEAAGALPASEAVNWKPRFPGSAAINPHWNPDRCTKCHQTESGRLLPIAPQAADALCLSCHDDVQAPADPHPIGRQAITEFVQTPPDWPTVDGAIGCLTCHDIQRHCDPAAHRPAVNTVLLRHYDPQRPLEYCTNCHQTEVGRRFSPHRQRDATARIRDDACFFCHTRRPDIPPDGRRRFEPHLRMDSSQLCLNCHSRHWDLSPRGHVDRPVTPRIHEWMLIREQGWSGPVNAQARTAPERRPQRQPARLPLGNNTVTCYTCHNPHYTGLFPPDSELGTLAHNAQDRASALRTDWIDLCSECHNR